MEQFLRKYFLFQGYTLAAISFYAAGLGACVMLNRDDYFPHFEMFYDFRFDGALALLVTICWMCVGASQLYGLHKEDIRFLYPFPVMYCVELFLLLIRDIFMFYTANEDWFFGAASFYLNPTRLGRVFYLTIHVMLSTVAISRIFAQFPGGKDGTSRFSERIFTWKVETGTGDDFERFGIIGDER